MKTDAELIAERRNTDDKRFMTSALSHAKAPRLAPALRAMRDLLISAPGWVTWEATLAAGLRSSDLSVKTVDNMIRKGVTSGVLEKRGEVERGARSNRADTRELRIVDWPAE